MEKTPPLRQLSISTTKDEGVSAATAMQLQGRPLSYNNVFDADAALELVKKFAPPSMRHHQTQ